MLESELSEYRSSMGQMTEKYEEALGELAVTREHLNNATLSMKEYQQTIAQLNNDIINNAENPSSFTDSEETSTSASFHGNGQLKWKDKLEKQQERYDELLRECQKYRNEVDLLMENRAMNEQLRREKAEMERTNRQLNEQLMEMSYSNVELEREISAVSAEMEEYKETVQYLQTENQNLINEQADDEVDGVGESQATPRQVGPSPTPKQNALDLKERASRKLSISKERSGSIDALSLGGKDSRNSGDTKDEEEHDDLFTMVQSYEDNADFIFSGNWLCAVGTYTHNVFVHSLNFVFYRCTETTLQDVADETQRKLMESQAAEERHSQRVKELEEEMRMVNDQLGGL